MRQIDAESLALIKQWEGLRLVAYRDQGGVWTIGYGHTGPEVNDGLTITPERAHDLLVADLGKAETVVENNVRVALTDGQFGALVSFVFNVGPGAYGVRDGFVVLKNGKPSSLLNALNAGQLDRVPDLMLQWVNVDHKPDPGLVNRRRAEIGLWNRGAFVASSTVVPTEAPAPSWRRVLSTFHLKLKAFGASIAGVGTLGLHLDGSTVEQAGQKIQTYAAQYHSLVALGVGVCILGIFLEVIHKSE